MAAEHEPIPRRFEPWPWLVAGLLASMIGVSLCFLTIAIQHPDPVVSGSIGLSPDPANRGSIGQGSEPAAKEASR